MRVGVITFPGSLDDRDTLVALARSGHTGVGLWHADTELGDVDAVILPGGFSYGDYLRCGAVAHNARIMGAVRKFAGDGGPVLGICNGFQILCESGLLPGALLRNESLRFTCRQVRLTVEAETAWTRGLEGRHLVIPVKNGEGRWYADEETVNAVEANGQVVFRYSQGRNPNGSVNDIAGVSNEAGNVVGLMPHPEHATDQALWGGIDGLAIFEALAAPVAA